MNRVVAVMQCFSIVYWAGDNSCRGPNLMRGNYIHYLDRVFFAVYSFLCCRDLKSDIAHAVVLQLK